MTIQEQLRDAAKKFGYYDDRVGGRAIDAYKRHLRLIADKVSELETAGFEVTAAVEPKKHGRAKVTIKRNQIELIIYNEWYQTYHDWYGDPEIGPLGARIATAVAVAKMFSPTAA